MGFIEYDSVGGLICDYDVLTRESMANNKFCIATPSYSMEILCVLSQVKELPGGNSTNSYIPSQAGIVIIGITCPWPYRVGYHDRNELLPCSGLNDTDIIRVRTTRSNSPPPPFA
jgi:hypothetical protein